MGRAAKLRQARRKFLASRPPTPSYGTLKVAFSSTALQEWVIREWESCLDFKLFVLHHDKQKLADALLTELCSQVKDDCDRDNRIAIQISPGIKLGIGVNVYSWTIWAFIENAQLSFFHCTSDGREFSLSNRD